MTPEQRERKRARERVANMTPEQIERKRARQRRYKQASYAAGGAQYMATMRWTARRTIKLFGLDLADYPRAMKLDDPRRTPADV